MTLWKVTCQEHKYPGMWHRWFRHQCVAVGWYSKWGFPLIGPTDNPGWARARNALQAMKPGDHVIVALQGNRVGRLGEITAKAMGDDQWDPLVPPSTDLEDGEMGRRVMVRWDLTVGPDDRDKVVLLPEDCRLTSGELRPTVSEIRSISLKRLADVMNEPANWIGLLAYFDAEQALSGYIAVYPHHLEDGLVPHPNEKVRERVFQDGSRLDVLLLDRDLRPVIVECKQSQLTVADVTQLRHYLERLQQETHQQARGILVHGGARKLNPEVRKAAEEKPRIEVVQYHLQVDFDASL